ncbi:MAG: CotH kinase family protein, partial [Gammaproteobacteria bacterium]
FGQGIVAETKRPVSMVFIDTYRGRASLRDTPDAQVRAGIELRGSSSLGFPKNNMSFETRDENTNDFAVPLLGLPAESDWVLYGPYTDKALMNDYLAYELWEAMGHYSVRRKFVEVFRDTTGGRLTYGDYWGIYVLLEKIKIDNDRVDIAELHGGDNTVPNVTGGYILKRDRFDGNEFTFAVPAGTGFGGTTLGVEDPKGAQISTAQKNYLVAWFAQVSAALSSPGWTNPVTGYAAYIDADSFIDHYWIVEMPKQIDGYRLSNFYHKDRNGKLKEGPIWDWNLAFGNANYLEGGLTNNYYAPAVGDADYLYYRRLFADPDFHQKHIDRWFALRTNIFATSNLLARVNAITNLLNESQARDFVKWPRLGTYIWPNPNGSVGGWHVDFQTPTTYAGIISEMKKWLTGRLAWIDAQFPAKPPVFSLPGGTVPSGTVLAITAPAGTIYYTVNGTDPRGAGGNPAPGVLTYSGAITITTNVGVFARARVGTGANSWSGPTVAPYVIETPKLIVTEIMFHPDPPPP